MMHPIAHLHPEKGIARSRRDAVRMLAVAVLHGQVQVRCPMALSSFHHHAMLARRLLAARIVPTVIEWTRYREERKSAWRNR
jgi:hypothetical protein